MEFREIKGITLIALVVTIVVLLISSGLSISLVIGNNGIITKAADSKLMSRAGSVEEEVDLWKNDSYIGKTTGLEIISKDIMLQGLIDKGLLYEEEIDRENEIITIKKKDGTIVKEIYYKNEDVSVIENYYVGDDGYGSCYLYYENTDEPTNFEEAFIEYNGETIDITSIICLSSDGSYNVIYGSDVRDYLKSIGKITYNSEIKGERYIIIIKDGVSYEGDVQIIWPE